MYIEIFLHVETNIIWRFNDFEITDRRLVLSTLGGCKRWTGR